MPALTIKVTLRHVEPPVWRRLRVPSTLTLAELHDVLQIALGWTNSHMHQFWLGRDTYGVADRESPETKDEKKTRLADIAKLSPRFVYAYDMGDGWEHDVVVEDTLDSDDDEISCVDGKRSVPPEDCGGPPGYEDLLEALANPKHPAHRDMKEWISPGWKADAFDVASINKRLRSFSNKRRKQTAMPKLRLVKPVAE